MAQYNLHNMEPLLWKKNPLKYLHPTEELNKP